MLAHSKNALPLLLVWPGTEYTSGTHLKEEFLDLFERYHGMVFSIPPHRQSNRQGTVNTLLMVNINPICKR